jgi:hypothetical protein
MFLKDLINQHQNTKHISSIKIHKEKPQKTKYNGWNKIPLDHETKCEPKIETPTSIVGLK